MRRVYGRLVTSPADSLDILRYAAFTSDAVGGNPAGVVLTADRLTDEAVLGIAADVGYSETAFLSSFVGGEGVLRYFSPLAEVAFCGHATIATAVALAERHGPGPMSFRTPAGTVDVVTRREGDEIIAALVSPPASSAPMTEAELDELRSTFGWAADDLDPRFPPHVGSAGNKHPLVGLRDRERLARFDYDYDALAGVMSRREWTTVHVFHERADGAFDVRNAFPPGGVREDPATGAAAAAFGAYLRDRGMLPPGAEVVLHQGVDMGVPCRLVISAVPDSTAISVAGAAHAIGPDTTRR